MANKVGRPPEWPGETKAKSNIRWTPTSRAWLNCHREWIEKVSHGEIAVEYLVLTPEMKEKREEVTSEMGPGSRYPTTALRRNEAHMEKAGMTKFDWRVGKRDE